MTVAFHAGLQALSEMEINEGCGWEGKNRQTLH